MKKINLILILILLSLFCFSFAFANNGDACFSTEPSLPGSLSQGQGPPTYDLLTNPSRISSTIVGSQRDSCAPATFSSATLTTAPVTTNNAPLTQEQIINSLTNNRQALSSNFDEAVERTIALLKTDPVWNYEVTLKRINNITDTPVFRMPDPTISYDGNIKLVIYKPYNFGVSDIAEALRKVRDNPSRVGVGIGAVSYDSNYEVTSAHMFTPLGIEINGHQQFNPGRGTFELTHYFKIYDPFNDVDTDILIKFDRGNLPMANVWKRRADGSSLWFNLEDMVIIEKKPRTGGGIIVDPPIRTPPRDGDTPRTGGGSTLRPIVKAAITGTCGNNVTESGEQCDDGNNINDDDCTNGCMRTTCGDGSIQTRTILRTAEECDPPNSICQKYVGNMCIFGTCSNSCTCNVQIPKIING